MNALSVISCSLLALLVAVSFYAVVCLRQIHSSLVRHHQNLESSLRFLLFEKETYSFAGRTEFGDSGFCVWVYRGGQWKIAADYSREGFEPGPPPAYSGSCEGYAVKQPSVKARR